MNLPGSVALILGDNIGTTITAQLASHRQPYPRAPPVAMAHTIFNVFGVVYMVVLFSPFVDIGVVDDQPIDGHRRGRGGG